MLPTLENLINTNINLVMNMNKKEKMYLQNVLDIYEYNLNIGKLDINFELLKKLSRLILLKKQNPRISTTCPKFRIIQLNNSKQLINKYFKLNKINSINNKLSPFDIPIELWKQEPFFGFLNVGNKNTIHSVGLSKISTELTGAIYSHEIVHSQLISNPGSVKELYNKELLSIFIELLYISNYKEKYPNIFQLHTYIRLKPLLNYLKSIILKEKLNIDIEPDIIDSTTFIISTINAYKLFDKYTTGNKTEQEYIIKSIQKIFDGNLILEDFLNTIDINWNIKKKKKSK